MEKRKKKYLTIVGLLALLLVIILLPVTAFAFQTHQKTHTTTYCLAGKTNTHSQENLPKETAKANEANETRDTRDTNDVRDARNTKDSPLRYLKWIVIKILLVAGICIQTILFASILSDIHVLKWYKNKKDEAGK